MRKYTTALVLASALVGAIAAVPALQAQDHEMSSGPTMGRGMMGDENQGGGMTGMMKMMKQMSGMMDHCSTMMQSRSSGRPNDQWRKPAPATPDKNG